MSNENSDKLLVRADYITRCEGCGTPYSPGCVGSQQGELYCSVECQSAAYARRHQIVGGFILLVGLILILIPEPVIILCGMWALFLGFCIAIRGIEGKSYSQRRDKYRNTQLLVCEYCNHISTSSVTVCENCGALLVDSEFASDILPDWFVPAPEFKTKKTWTMSILW